MKTKIITVNVTAKDISKGERGHCGACPIAIAVLRRTNPEYETLIGGLNIFFGKKALVKSIRLPAKATDFISNFDRGLSVHPFRFKLEIPTKFLK